MKIKIDIDLTPEEAKDLLVPSDKQTEFQMKTYDAFVKAMQHMIWDQVDPYDMMQRKNRDA